MESRTGDFADVVAFVGEFSHDPLGFVYAAFPWGAAGTTLDGLAGPDAWQREVLEDVGAGVKDIQTVVREAVASGHGVGKSALVAWLVLWAMATHEETRCIVTANTDTQLRTKTWPELSKWYRLFIARDMFRLTATSLFSVQEGHDRTWRADAIPWSKDNPEAFAGLHNQGKRILVIFDEASAIDDAIWTVTEGAMTDRDTEIVWCAFGNPTRNQGRFFECFHKNRTFWHCKQVDSRTVAISNKQQIAQWEAAYGDDSDFFRVRVKGEFPSQSDRQFISAAIVEEATQRVIHSHEFSFAPVVIGVDPAWTGEDSFEIFLRQGSMCKSLASFARNDDDMRMAEIIARFEDEYHAMAVNIDQGYGTGIYSIGRNMGRCWNLISFASKATDETYANKRAQMWGELKAWLKDVGALPEDSVLASDLTGPEAFINLRGKLQLESKEDMKRRGLASPNKADALALTFALPVRQTDNSKYRQARRMGRAPKAGSM